MTKAERMRRIEDIRAGVIPEREVDLPGMDGLTAVTLLLWADGSVTWK